MASASQIDWTNSLAGVQLDVRQAGARAVSYPLGGIDFLIGSVPGCDLRATGDGAGVLCLFARHPAGVTLRKLTTTRPLLVNGQAVSHCELSDGDSVQVGALEILVRVVPAAVTSALSPQIDRDREELRKAGALFRERLAEFQKEKDTFERLKQRHNPQEFEERGLEVERQQRELTRMRQEMADLRQQLYAHYEDRRERLADVQEDLEKSKQDIVERGKKLSLEEQDAAESRQRDRARQEDLDRRLVEVTQQALRVDEDRKRFEARQLELLEDWDAKNADLADREKAVADKITALEPRLKQYEADVLRQNRREGEFELRAADLDRQAAEGTKRREALDRDLADFETQVQEIDAWRSELAAEADRLAKQKEEQSPRERQLDERASALEGQQASLAFLRGRLERMRDTTRAREQQLDEQRARQETLEIDLKAKQEEIDKHVADMQNDKELQAREHEQMTERSAVMEAAVRQLKAAQDELVAEQDRLRKEAQALDDGRRQLSESEGVLQARLTYLADAQGRLDLERQNLRDRGLALLQREEACQALQEQLHRRTEEIGDRHKEITEGLLEHQTRLNDLDERQKQLDQREQELNRQIETWKEELKQKAQALQQRHLEVTGVEGAHHDQLTQLALQRQTHAEERAQFQLEQRAALEKFVQARAELETMRKDALAMVEQLPDAELRAGAVVERLTNARTQLRSHLGEIHEYVRQCQDELVQLRTRLQADLDKLLAQEETLRRHQDEHRLETVAFRQQLIDWQGQFGDLQRLLARDESRLERREAKAEERARVIEEQSVRLAQQAEVIEEQEREVAERREEVDRHLVDMREWYRRKMRELAGVPLIPLPAPPGRAAGSEDEPSVSVAKASEPDEDAGIVPINRSILSIANAADPGDRQLGQTLLAAQLIDTDTLTALLAEARRQRRSLRQVLLASGVITLYQLALIEVGNLDGLMLGPVRVIDRLRNTGHEAVYRVFDPRRGAEAVLRHLSEADLADAVRPDEFRQRFTQARLNDIHVANTLEVLDLAGRPAAMQEWLTGLPATDWPPLAAAPGVCYRLLTQAAQGLAAVHQAGAIHGHLSDALLLLTAEGVLKICGLGEPPWLIGLQYDDEPTMSDDLRALGKIVSGWCTPTGVRKGAKTKPLPEALVTILYRLAADGEAGYRDVKELLADLERASSAIPANAEAWDRLVKYVREHGTPEALVRQSA